MILEKTGLSKRQKQSKLFGWLIGIGVLLIVIAVLALIPVTPYKVYQDSSARIRLKYPAAWEKLDRPNVPGA